MIQESESVVLLNLMGMCHPLFCQYSSRGGLILYPPKIHDGHLTVIPHIRGVNSKPVIDEQWSWLVFPNIRGVDSGSRHVGF